MLVWDNKNAFVFCIFFCFPNFLCVRFLCFLIFWICIDYLSQGVPANKLSLGLALYGHTWLVPGLNQENQWAKFGIPATISPGCCQAWNHTYGSQPGQYCIQCGMFTIDEIYAAGFDTIYDEETNTNIGYLTHPGSDGYTYANTWVSYQDKESITSITQFAKQMNLAGVFVFDISMDIMSQGRTVFTFNMTQLAYQTFVNSTKQEIQPIAEIQVQQNT